MLLTPNISSCAKTVQSCRQVFHYKLPVAIYRCKRVLALQAVVGNGQANRNAIEWLKNLIVELRHKYDTLPFFILVFKRIYSELPLVRPGGQVHSRFGNQFIKTGGFAKAGILIKPPTPVAIAQPYTLPGFSTLKPYQRIAGWHTAYLLPEQHLVVRSQLHIAKRHIHRRAPGQQLFRIVVEMKIIKIIVHYTGYLIGLACYVVNRQQAGLAQGLEIGISTGNDEPGYTAGEQRF